MSGAGYWTVTTAEPTIGEGTSITLYLSNDAAYLSNRTYIENAVLKYCRLIPFPIYFQGESKPVWAGRREPVVSFQESGFIDQIESLLSNEGFMFQREPSIGGLRPDFLVNDDQGRSLVIEAKKWSREPGYIRRALHQIGQYKSATGADAVIVVLPGQTKGVAPEGISSLDDLASEIRREFSKPKSIKKKKPVRSHKKVIFAAMPFSEEYDDTFFVAMAPAAEEIGAVCVRVDKEEFSGNVVEKIQTDIKESVAVIGDLSESKPNVLYEVGFAHALNKPVVHLTSTDTKQLPFDVRNWSTILYEKGRTHRLKIALVERLRAIIH